MASCARVYPNKRRKIDLISRQAPQTCFIGIYGRVQIFSNRYFPLIARLQNTGHIIFAYKCHRHL